MPLAVGGSGARIVDRTIADTAYVTALTSTAAGAESARTSTPARSGPTASAAVIDCSSRALARGSRTVGTSRGRKDWCAVVEHIDAVPTTNISPATRGTVSSPARPSTATVPSAMAQTASPMTSTGRRGTRSIRTPATRPNSSIGSHWAERTSPRSAWSAPRVSMSSSCSARPEVNSPNHRTVSDRQSRTKAG